MAMWRHRQKLKWCFQATKCLKPPETGKGQEGTSPRGLEGSTALLTTWIWTPSLPKYETMHFYCFRPQFIGLHYSSPRKLIQTMISIICVVLNNSCQFNETQFFAFTTGAKGLTGVVKVLSDLSSVFLSKRKKKRSMAWSVSSHNLIPAA